MVHTHTSLNYLGHDIKSSVLIPRQSAWLRHGPFATWLVKAARPRKIVELGTHYGFSYFVMCEAVKEAKIDAECFAVDTWRGDEHAGLYGSEVYEWVCRENDQYANFSTLLRKTFADALADIEDGSVDLLHIDGRHFYEDVKEDFESWIPKLSQNAIVLFHDTEVRKHNFGVYRYWNELTQIYPSFNFSYQHGLGVLFFGNTFSYEINALKADVATSKGLKLVQGIFEAAGECYVKNAQIARMKHDLEDLSSDLTTREMPNEIEELAIEVRAIISARDYYWSEVVAQLQAKADELYHFKLSEISRKIDDLKSENNKLVTVLRVAQRFLRNPFSNLLRYHLAKIIISNADWLNEKASAKLKKSISKRSLDKVDEILKNYNSEDD